MKKRIYIAGKITGMEERAKELFQDAEDYLRNLEHEPVNPMKLEHKHGGKWQDYMKEGILAMMDCDAVFMLENWRDSEGATIEHKIAVKLKMLIFYQENGPIR